MAETTEELIQEKKNTGGRPRKNAASQEPENSMRKMRKIKFMNNEDPEVDLAFTFITKNGTSETYRLYPGYEYELPTDVINHLNSLAYPVYQTQIDSETQQIVHKQVGSHNRFSCHPME